MAGRLPQLGRSQAHGFRLLVELSWVSESAMLRRDVPVVLKLAVAVAVAPFFGTLYPQI